MPHVQRRDSQRKVEQHEWEASYVRDQPDAMMFRVFQGRNLSGKARTHPSDVPAVLLAKTASSKRR